MAIVVADTSLTGLVGLHFLGGTGTVTGSKFLLDADGEKVLVDCGLFQGLKDLRLKNWAPFPIDVEGLGWVLLTHAHVDHTGYLPRIVKQGFHGEVLCSASTLDLSKLLLPDSAHLQEEDAKYANKEGFSTHRPALPLYTVDDAHEALNRFKEVSFHQEQDLSDRISFLLRRAGHILGASTITVHVRNASSGGEEKIVFSGDLGQHDSPLMPDPEPILEADYLILESTYGDRLHSEEDPKKVLEKVVNSTVNRGGSVIIPAFAVGRTQQVMFYLRELEDEGKIPKIPLYVDSPLAIEATELYCKHLEDHKREVRLLEECPLACGNTKLTRSVEESKAINTVKEPCIIVSASGMATGGRVLHHLKVRLPDERNTVLFVGYQAAGTRGRAMLDGAESVKIHGKHVPVRARVEKIDSLSGHADWKQTLEWLRGFRKPPKRTFLVHGEPEASKALKYRIEQNLGWNTTIPAHLNVVKL